MTSRNTQDRKMGLTIVASISLAIACATARAQLAPSDSPAASASIGVAQGTAPGSDPQSAGVTARSARLSFLTEGSVQIVRGNQNERSLATQNMPLAQGDRVAAAESGQAEIEFEDGSVARITPNSTLSLDFLGTDSGSDGSITILRVIRGLVYLEMRSAAANRFRVMAGGDTLWPVENTVVRINLDDPPPVIAVLDGRVRVEHVATASGDIGGPQIIEGYRTDVKAGESLRSDAAEASRYFLSEGIALESWDHWNETRDQAAADAAAQATVVRDNYAANQGYGWSDLDANGTWYDATGESPIWQPQEALTAGFDPYGYGNWTYFPGAGYSWASSYAWGWTPYRCGRWNYWDGFGWGWQPDAFCGNYGRFGLGATNVYGGPRGYRPPLVPIKRRDGVHPILPGPHPGERPPFERRNRTQEDRHIAGVIAKPIIPAGVGYTPRGGSALGSSLRRDYPIDGRTHLAVTGIAAAPTSQAQRQPSSAPMAWRSVTTRPEPPAASSGGRILGIFGHSSRPTTESPIHLDPRGNPYVQPTQRATGVGNFQNRATQQVQGQSISTRGTEHSQPVNSQTVHSQSGYRPQPSAPPQNHSYPSAPRMEQHSAPPPPPAVHSAPAPPPANSSGSIKK